MATHFYKVHPVQEPKNALKVQAESDVDAACKFLLERPTHEDLIVAGNWIHSTKIRVKDVAAKYPDIKALVDTVPEVVKPFSFEESRAKPGEYERIGGWLWVFLLSLGMLVLTNGYSLFLSLRLLGSEQLLLIDAEYPGFANCVRLDLVWSLLLCLLSLFAIPFFFMRKRFVRGLCLLILGLNVGAALCSTIWLDIIVRSIETGTLIDCVRALLVSGVWIAYLLRSRRVRNTFVM